MSELPDELRALLELARDGHDPTDPEAKTRVRQGVAASLLLSGAAAASGSASAAANAMETLSGATRLSDVGVTGSKAGWLLFGGKLSTLMAGALLALGLTAAAYHYTRPNVLHTEGATAASVPALPVPSLQPTVQPTLSLVPEPQALPAPLAAEMEPATKPAARDPLRPAKSASQARVQPTAESLAAETALLHAASDALARGDQLAALVPLREHARKYPSGSLREEREGLRAIVECTRQDAPNTSSAKRFLRMSPHSLLSARVSKACALD